MGFSTCTTLLLSFFTLFSMLQMPAMAIQKSYIVYMGGQSHGREITKDGLNKVSDSHTDFLAKYLKSKEKAKEAIFVSYRRFINGFAANLDEKVADEIAKDPEVVSVFLNKERKLQTTYSWDFLSLEKNNFISSSSLWKKAKFGEDVIIGNIDSGVWPESQSFSDEGYGPVPSRWKGICQKGLDPTFSCNRKLIGARYYKAGLEASTGQKVNASVDSPRDFSGHGTHTLATAGGGFVPEVNVLGFGNGTAKGGAPRVRVATYKACWAEGCMDADVLKAIDHAIYDGVDVISGSLAMDAQDYMFDSIAIGTMNAVKHDIVVVMGGGNSGPNASTITNVAPWMLTVGASSTDRQFETIIELGNGLRLKGTSISKPLAEDKMYPLVTGTQAKVPGLNASYEEYASQCLGMLYDPAKVQGKILVCEGNTIESAFKGSVASQSGAVGVIVCNNEVSGAFHKTYVDVLPSAFLTYKDGLVVLDYIKSTTDPMAVIKPPIVQFGTKPAPMMAIFSSKGPNLITPEILKVCEGNTIESAFKGSVASQSGAVGVIVCNNEVSGAFHKTYVDVLPSAFLTYKDGLVVLDYIKSTTDPMAVIKPPIVQFGTKPAPMMAIFSSKGPNLITPEILKPDITAPGVDIIAAWSPEAAVSYLPKQYDPRSAHFSMASGTSMACPHVAGVAALLRAIYPKWSPAAIRSAIMTSATPLDNTGHPIMNSSLVDATPFAYGSGHIQPDRAADPGLIYDLHMKDYLNFLCVSGYNNTEVAQFYRKEYNCPQYSDEISLLNFNYPSITVPALSGTVTVKRKVKNVGPAGTYKAQVTEPQGISVVVHPEVLEFKKTSDQKSFNLTLTAKEGGGVGLKNYVFGALVWSDGVHTVRSPITVAIA